MSKEINIYLAQRMKSWRFRLWYRWSGFLFKIKMMLQKMMQKTDDECAHAIRAEGGRR